MLQSEVRPVDFRMESRAKLLLANVLLPFGLDFFLSTVRDAESVGDDVDLVGFSVLADNK